MHTSNQQKTTEIQNKYHTTLYPLMSCLQKGIIIGHKFLTCSHQRCLKNKAYHGSCHVALYLVITDIANTTSCTPIGGSHEVMGRGYVSTENSQMAYIGVIFSPTYHTKQLNPWPNSSASRVVIITASCILFQRVGAI